MAVALFIWGFIQSFVVGIIIPLVKKARSNYLLSLIFISTSFNILFQYLLRYRELKNTIPEFLILPDILDLILPALVLIYVYNILGKPFVTRRFGYLIIPLIWSLVLISFVIVKHDFGFHTYIGSTFHKISLTVIFLWKFFICYKGLSIYKKESESINQKQASLFLWPKVLVIFLGFLSYIAFITLCYWVAVGTHYGENAIIRFMQELVEVNYLLFTSSIIFITIFFSLKYPKILSGSPLIKRTNHSDFPEGKKYLEELNSLIINERIHLDTELDEKKLAETLGVHSYILSKLLNEYLGKSFSEFINEKRIDEAKRLLGSEEHNDLTVFAIAVDSGFRSESVFYVNFKKITGQTPIQYKKMLKSQSVKPKEE